MVHCEECGKTNVPLVVVIFSLKNKMSLAHYIQSPCICVRIV